MDKLGKITFINFEKLCDFVNVNNIEQRKIQQIFHVDDVLIMLYWFYDKDA